jgi:oxalate decarboxylase
LKELEKIVKNEFEKHVIRNDPETVDQVTESREEFSRRNILGSTLATAALAGLTAYGQETQNTRKAERDKSVSNPAQENKALLAENPNSNMPPPTDHGDIGPVWYSFDLVHNRIQEGGWTQRGELQGFADLKGSGWRKHATHRGQLPRIALAHRG